MQTDRRTRDRVRLFFWAVLTVVCLVAVLVARQQQAQGLQRKTDAAQERAIRFTQNVLADRLDARRVARPIERSGYDELLAELKRGLFNDQRVVRVRVWRSDGLLVFTTDHRSEIGVTRSDDARLRSALRGDLVGAVVNESFGADDSTTPEQTMLFSTYIPLRASDKADVFGVVQIDNDYAIMVDASSHPWKEMQVAFAIVALLCLVMAIVSFVWSHRKEEVAGFGPSRRDVRAAARDEKKADAARAESTKLRERVKELEGKSKSIAEQRVELEKLRGRVAEFEQRSAQADAGDPVEVAQLKAHATQLKAHATQLEERARGSESRVEQLQARITEMESQLRVTTDQLRVAQKRTEEVQAAQAAEGVVPAPIRAQLDAAAETEQLLRAELEASRADFQRVEQEREAIERAHSEEARSQQGQLDQVRAQARLAEEERQRVLAEAAKSPTAQPAISVDAEARIMDLTQQLERSEAERAMLRAGRPETLYEARNRQLEDELSQLRGDLMVAEERARSGDASKAGVDPGVIATLEERIAAAEERALEAERRLDEAKLRRSRSRATQRGNGNGNADGAGDVAPAEPEPEAAADADALEKVDGSELRSRLVRSTDARRRGIATPTPAPTPAPKRR